MPVIGLRKFSGSIICALTLSSCATNSGRFPSSNEEFTLSQIVEQIQIISEKQKIEPSSCKENYDQASQAILNLAGDVGYLDSNDQKALDEEINNSFMARLALKETFKDFKGDNECLKSATNVFNGLRYVEDYLIEIRMEKSGIMLSEYVSLKGEFPYLLVNPKYKNDFKSYEDLKSGDVILSRGNAFSSANVFGFVYKNPESLEVYTTENHIEIGSVVEPIIDHIENKNVSEIIFRYKDSDISEQASKNAYDKVLDEQSKKNNIEYDFSNGFKKVLAVKDSFPNFNAKLSIGSLNFLNTNNSGDIQFDSRFDIVAEWRNPRKTEERRIKDFILTAIFEKIEKDNYKFDAPFKTDPQLKNYWLLRRLPVVKKFLQNDFPLSLPATQMELLMTLDKASEDIYKEVEKAGLEFDRPMTPKEIYTFLDEFFKQDFELYKRYKKGQEVVKPTFHLLFHP